MEKHEQLLYQSIMSMYNALLETTSEVNAKSHVVRELTKHIDEFAEDGLLTLVADLSMELAKQTNDTDLQKAIVNLLEEIERVR